MSDGDSDLPATGAGAEFRLLGPVEAWQAGKRIEFGQPRQRSVAAVLLTEANRVVPTGTLIERVWGEQPPASARSALYSYLTRIKTIIGPLHTEGEPVRLARASGGYLLQVGADAVDLHRFTRLVDQARAADDPGQAAAAWAAGLELWRGDPYQELASPWLDQMRDTLRQRWLAVVLDRNDVELARGRHADLLSELTGLTDQYPFDERLAGQLMLAAYRCGRQAEALEHYQAVRRRLADDLGIGPGPSLSALNEQLLRNDPALATPAGPVAGESDRPGVLPAQLPRDGSGFVGRAEALARLDALLLEPGATPATGAIVVITGSAGVGKTALGLHWAHRAAHRFPDGQLYVNLRGFDATSTVMDPGEAVRRFLEALGVSVRSIPADLDAQAALLRSCLAGRRILMVLDNARDTTQIRPLLPGSGSCAVVVTSRNQLTGLIAADGAQPLHLDVLGHDESRRLLVARLGAGRAGVEPAAVDAIIGCCARLPLALALAAARAVMQPQLALRAVADELRDARQRWITLAADDPSNDVQAVFSWSYEALTPAAGRLFRLLGLHPGPDIAIPAAAGLAASAPGTVRALLTELVRSSLLVEHATGRYTCHDLLRAYAKGLEPDADDRPEAHARLLDHYVRTAYAAALLLVPGRESIGIPVAERVLAAPETLADLDAVMAWFTAERPVLIALTLSAAGEGFDRQSWQLAWAMDTYLYRQGPWHDLVTVWQAALAAGRRLGDLAAQAYAHRRLARAYTLLDRPDDAARGYRRALGLYCQAGDLGGQAHTHHDLAILFERHGRLPDALRQAELALAATGPEADALAHASYLNTVGFYRARLGDFAGALRHCRQSLAIYRRIGGAEGEASVLDSLGYIHHGLREYDEAIDCFQQALDSYREVGDRYWIADTLTHLGDTYQACGRASDASAAWREALALLDDLGHSHAADVRLRLEQPVTQRLGLGAG